ncbi:hypothetical protein BH11ARM1_BH11ARM1_14620 [soil metagenome]
MLPDPQSQTDLFDDTEDSDKRHILWLKWQRFYVNPSISDPEVVVRDRHVLDANLSAYERGVVPGMDLPTVRNLASGCILTPWQEENFVERQQKWLDLCVPFTGEIEPIDGHIAALDLSGHPQPLDIARRLIEHLQDKVNLPLRAGIASTKWLARLAARQNELQSAIRNPKLFLESLSIQDLLPVQQAHRDRLAALGYHKIGQLAKVSLATLRGQFGDEALKISLAAEGKILERVLATYPPDILHEHLLFDGPVDDELMVDSALGKMARCLGKRITGRQASNIELKIDTELDPQTSKRRFTRPCHNAATLLPALRALRSSQPTDHPVTGIHVTLSEVERARSDQLNLCIVRPNVNVDQTLKSLQNVFGEGTVKLASQVEISRRKRVLKEWRDASGWH